MFEWGRAICYSGYRQGQSPKNATYPTYEQIKEDLTLLNELGFKYLRMYDLITLHVSSAYLIGSYIVK